MNESFEDRTFDEFDEAAHEADRYPRAGLLVTLLLHYPQLARVRVRPQEALLTLSFLLHSPLAPRAYDTLRQEAIQRLNLLSYVEGHKHARAIDFRQRREGRLAVLESDRDLYTLTAEEFPLLMDVITKTTGSLLIVDPAEGPVTSSLHHDDISITEVLDSTEIPQVDAEIIGVRDSGRVLVFRQG